VELNTGFPFRGQALEELRNFLRHNGLAYDEGVEFSVVLREENRITAAGSLDGRTLKCIAVDREFQGSGAAARVVTELVAEAARRGRHHLFIFTKPEKDELFRCLGFFPIATTGDILLMENKKDGISNFVKNIAANTRPLPDGAAGEHRSPGAVVVNCNPFSRGHRYLLEAAAQQCAPLYVFVVAENKSVFSADARMRMVVAGTADLFAVSVHSTGPYLVSSVTFPDYFLKDTVPPEEVNTELDLAIFAERFAGPLGIRVRFAGTEPFDPVTRKYNRQMAEILPRYHIDFVEIPRLESGGSAISAGRIRKLLEEGNLEAVRELVPPTTMDYVLSLGREA
jgi:[citrate (pro-3S)-lyase] ligase